MSVAGDKKYSYVAHNRHIPLCAPRCRRRRRLRRASPADTDGTPTEGPERHRCRLCRPSPDRDLQPPHPRLRRDSVSFRVKDYRRDEAGRPRVMTLSAAEFIRCFLLHVLPRGFHRIRHYGFLTGSNRTAGLDHIRAVLGVPAPPRPSADAPDPQDSPGQARPPYPCCGGPMTIVGSFAGWHQPRGPPFRSTSHRAGSP